MRSSDRMAPTATPLLPYVHLNLRWNPFGELTTEEWTSLAVVDIDEVVQSLSQPKTAVQYIGDKGYGKTTHLLALRARFPSSGYVHIPEGETRPVPSGSPLLIDEAQRLTWRQRRMVFGADIPLVLGTHRDFTGALRRAGREVTTIHVERNTNAERLHRIVNARIQAARRSPGPVPSVSRQTVGKMLDEYGPNIRRIVQSLYVSVQEMRDTGEL